MRELVIISGKGGTGKTSITASFALLANRPVVADCDVDAADLHLVLVPETRERHQFRSGYEAVIREDDCAGCGICRDYCRFDAVLTTRKAGTGYTQYSIDPIACEGCGVCVRECPDSAIDFPERLCGEWMISETRVGPMVHACLSVAAENSGKLVSIIRREAKRIAQQQDRSLILVDGPPGIGCPVIASITGASMVLVVTEPTVSGEHDLKRVISLTRHFGIPTALCVNKWDINPEITNRIEENALRAAVVLAGRIRYDHAVTIAQMRERAVVELDTLAGSDIQNIWHNLLRLETADTPLIGRMTRL